MLEHLKVLDLTDEKASFCAKLLADLGACVIKIEKPQGDPCRMLGPFWHNLPHPERSLSFWYNNTNKFGITLNLEHADGVALFLKLVAGADVLVENFPPGYLQELGLGFEVLIGTNPKIIMASVSAFGQTGPRSKFKSCDLVASAYGGQMYVTGSSATPPLQPYGEQSHYSSSLFAAIGVLLALRKRETTGRGDLMDVSTQEAVVSTLDHVLVNFFYDRAIAKRQGSLHWNNSFCILPCRDGFIVLTVFHQWETLVEWLDNEGMAADLKDEAWQNDAYRHEHMDHVLAVLRKWTALHKTGDLFELGQLMGFPWAPVYSLEEVRNSPQLQVREFFVNVDHPELNVTLKYPGLPYKFMSSGKQEKKWKRAPLPGEDNLLVYTKTLGLSEEEIQRLTSLHVI